MRQRTRDSIHQTRDLRWGCETGCRRWETGGGRQEMGNSRWETGDVETGGRRLEMGDRSQKKKTRKGLLSRVNKN